MRLFQAYKEGIKNSMKPGQRGSIKMAYFILAMIILTFGVAVFANIQGVDFAEFFIFLAVFLLVIQPIGIYLGKKLHSKMVRKDDSN